MRAWDPAYCIGADRLTDGEIISLEDVTPQIEVVYTPGHMNDSVCFFIWSGVPHESTLEGIVTGDTIAGRHTTMISETDGDLGLYLKTLALLGVGFTMSYNKNIVEPSNITDNQPLTAKDTTGSFLLINGKYFPQKSMMI